MNDTTPTVTPQIEPLPTGTSQPGKRLWVLWMMFFFQFAAIGIYFTFLNVYYRQAGLTGTQIGMINMASALVAMGSAVLWGNLSDRTGQNRLIIAGGGAGALLVAQVIPFVHGFWAYMGLALLGSVASSALGGLVDSTTLLMLGDKREDYGRYRLGGSIGYILTASSVGFLLDRVGMNVMFPGYGILMVGFVVMAFFLPNMPVRREAREPGVIGTMMRQPAWILIMVVVFLVWIATTASIMFTGVVLQSMGASRGLIGIALTIGAVIEMPFMLFSGSLLRRYGPVKLLLVAISLSVIRYFLLGLLKDPVWAIAINMLNGPAYVLFWNSAVNYINRLSPPGLTATGQGMFNSVINFAGVVSALLTGILFDAFGVGLFEVMAACCLVALLLFAVGTLGKHDVPDQQASSFPSE